MNINFLFWNIHGEVLNGDIEKIAFEKNVDFFILAESQNLDKLPKGYEEKILMETANSQKLTLWVKKNLKEKGLNIEDLRIIQLNPSDRYFVYKFNINSEVILLIGLHLASQLNTTEEVRYRKARKVIKRINEIKKELNTENIIICGDFNMNPFESGMVSPDGFNAVMCEIQANKKTVIADGEKYNYLYNPCFSLYGNSLTIAKGSYYYNRSSEKNYFWHLFDQVIFSPTLIKKFNIKELEIIERIKEESYLNLDRTKVSILKSDHLPLFFSFKFNKEEANV